MLVCHDAHEDVDAVYETGGVESFQGFGYLNRATYCVDQFSDTPRPRALKEQIEDDPLDPGFGRRTTGSVGHEVRWKRVSVTGPPR